MKNFSTMIFLGGLVALFAVMPAAAQTSFGNQLNVAFKAPMAFYAGDAKMPAGSYHIMQGVGPEMLVVRSDKGHHEAIIPYTAISNPEAPPKNVEVTFNKYGNDEYLNSIKFGSISSRNSTWLLKINPSAAEQAAAKAASATAHTIEGTTATK